MASDLKRKLQRKYKRFKRWVHSDDFTQLMAKAIALFVIFLMIFAIFVVLL
ncbi:MAG: hypothetical protein KAU14_02315 [Thermoplasmata archaeon]|nr:hypothetical protein [Thermoplasmata archaeon]